MGATFPQAPVPADPMQLDATNAELVLPPVVCHMSSYQCMGIYGGASLEMWLQEGGGGGPQN